MDSDIIFENPIHEKMAKLATDWYRRVYAEQDPQAILSWLAPELASMQAGPNTDMRLLWPDSFALYEAELKRREELAKLPVDQRRQYDFPWPSWNELIDPIEPGMLMTIAGPDGSGKTTYAENLAEHWARRGQRVVLVHWELSRIIMLDRRAARHTAIARRQLKLAENLTAADRRRLEDHKRLLMAWPGEITYLHTPGKTMEQVLLELRALQRDGLCDIAILDYLEKASASPAQVRLFGANLFAREAHDVEQVKVFSEDAAVPVVMLAQMSKAGKSQTFDTLDRTAMRGAGEKSEKANIVILLKPDTMQGSMMNVRLDKNTLGALGSWQQYVDWPRFQVADVLGETLL